MASEITVSLHYRENGEKKTTSFLISFISQWMIDKFAKGQRAVMEFNAKHEHLKNLNLDGIKLRHKIEALKLEPEWEDKHKIEIERLQAELLAIGQEIETTITAAQAIDLDSMDQSRFELICEILTENGYKNDPKFFDPEFWNRRVDPKDMTNFIERCINKEVEAATKKKSQRT